MQQLQRAQNCPLNGQDPGSLEPTATHSICIRLWTPASRYDLLLTRADQACLEVWLQRLQSTPNLASQT